MDKKPAFTNKKHHIAGPDPVQPGSFDVEEIARPECG
jgi:hypothetical protein